MRLLSCLFLFFFISKACSETFCEKAQIEVLWQHFSQEIEIDGFKESEVDCNKFDEEGELKAYLGLAMASALRGTKIPFDLFDDDISENNNYLSYVLEHLQSLEVIMDKKDETCKKGTHPFRVNKRQKQGVICYHKLKQSHVYPETIAGWMVWMARAIERGDEEKLVACKKGKFKGKPLCEEHLFAREDDEQLWEGGDRNGQYFVAERNSFRHRFLRSHRTAEERLPDTVALSESDERIVKEIREGAKNYFNELTRDEKDDIGKLTQNQHIFNF